MKNTSTNLITALRDLVATFEQDGWTATRAMQCQRTTMLEHARDAMAQAVMDNPELSIWEMNPFSPYYFVHTINDGAAVLSVNLTPDYATFYMFKRWGAKDCIDRRVVSAHTDRDDAIAAHRAEAKRLGFDIDGTYMSSL